VEGGWKPLQASGLYERRRYLTEIDRNDLAQEVLSLGSEIDSRRDFRGRDRGFEIRRVAEVLLERYSQRSAQRDAAIEEFREQHGRKPSDNEVAVLVRKSRADKLTEIATEQDQRQRRARLSPEESNSLDRRDLLNVRDLLAGHTGCLASRIADTVRQAILAAYCPPSPVLPSVLLPSAQAAEPFPSALVHLNHGAQILFRRVP
jgi:hypothetical protein